MFWSREFINMLKCNYKFKENNDSFPNTTRKRPLVMDMKHHHILFSDGQKGIYHKILNVTKGNVAKSKGDMETC